MPTTRITMRQIRQALRLHLEAGLSYAQVARAVGIGKATVGKFVLLARAAGVDWAGGRREKKRIRVRLKASWPLSFRRRGSDPS